MTVYLFVGIFFTLLIGYPVICKVLPAVTLSEKIALSFSIGLGIVVSLFAVTLFFEILYSPSQLLSIIGFCALSLYLTFKSSLAPGLSKENENYKPDASIFVISILVLMSLLISTWYPVFVTDGIDYEITGKLISLNKNLASDNYMRAYPPLVTLSYGYVYFLGGSNPKFLFSLLYACLCIIFYWRLIGFGVSRKLSSTMTLMLASTPIIWWHSFLGLLNFTAAFYFVCASLFWLTYLHNSEKQSDSNINHKYLLLAGSFYGFAVFTRLEFLVYFFIPFIQTMHYHRDSVRYKKVVSFFLAPVLVYGFAWGAYFIYLSKNKHSVNSTVSPDIYLLILFFISILPLLYRPIMKLNMVNLLMKNIKSCIFFLGGIILLLPISVYLIIEYIDLFPGDSSFIKSLFFLKVFSALSVYTIISQIFFGISSLIVIFAFPSFLRLLRKNSFNQYLLTFIILFLFINTLIFSKAAFNRYPDHFAKPYFYHDIIFLAKVVVLNPGMLVNNTQTRSFIALFPLLLLVVAVTFKNKQKIIPNNSFPDQKYLVINSVIVCNLLVLALFFLIPRVQFMISHWGESRNQLLLSSGPKDNPNMSHLRNIYKALVEIEDQGKDNYPVFLENPKFSKAEALKILFPRKVYFGAQEIEGLINDIERGSNKPDCYSFSFIGQKLRPVEIDKQLCRNFKHISIEKSESHLSKLKELRQKIAVK